MRKQQLSSAFISSVARSIVALAIWSEITVEWACESLNGTLIFLKESWKDVYGKSMARCGGDGYAGEYSSHVTLW
jgi:hypothetical protein